MAKLELGWRQHAWPIDPSGLMDVVIGEWIGNEANERAVLHLDCESIIKGRRSCGVGEFFWHSE